MLCGQVRPIDIELLEERYPGVFTPDGNPEIDVIISTQSLEVGVDLDLAGMVTELASGSALAQRAGRVNRRGQRENGPVTVFVPDSPIRTDISSGPYSSDELSKALDWLQRRAADPSGLAPWTLREDPPPPARQRRTLFQRPELGQVWHWARTSDDLAAEPDLDLWLSDDLEPDSTVGILVRRDLPDDIADAIELVKFLRPRTHEVFPVPLRTARQALADALHRARTPNPLATLTAILVRGDNISPLDWAASDNTASENTAGADNPTRPRTWPRIRPGDLVVLDATTPLFTAATRDDHRTPPVLVTGDEMRPYPADDVLEATALLGRGLRPGEVVHRIELNKEATLADRLALPSDPDAEPLDERATVLDWLDTEAADHMARAAAALLHTAADRQVDVVVQRDSQDAPVRVVIIDGRRAFADEDVRQEWTPNPNPIRLAAHQADVAERVVALAQRVGLPDDLRAALREAALHHDDGKADPRFQNRLGARGPAPLAKSHDLARPATNIRDLATPETIRRRPDRSGLPPRWRHEQRSVVDAWPVLPTELDRDLIARLIGTTHGHGRPWFPHTASDLLTPCDSTDTQEIAALLFDEGGWDELIEDTQLRYGVWGCAYLEALLRAADGQISAEGR
jgi:CRISPR-associated endonuclease/helicase Cas3